MATEPAFGTPDEENPEWTAKDFARAERGAPWARPDQAGEPVPSEATRLHSALRAIAEAAERDDLATVRRLAQEALQG